MKHAIKALEMLRDDRIKEYDRLGKISAARINTREIKDVKEIIQNQLYEINSELNILKKL